MALPPLKQVITADVSQFESAIGGAMSTLKKFAGIAGIGAAVAGIKSMTAQAMSNIDAQAKLARSVGGTTAALQSLTRAGDRAGVQQSEMASAVTRLNQRLGQVIATGKGADDTFAALGISAQELSGMDIDDRFVAIANSMREAGMSTQEMSYHLRELGIRQASVITLIQGGAEEIQRSRQALEDFGVAVSEVDAASIERANDALSEVGRVFEGLQNQIAIKLAPAIEAMANAFTEAAREGGPVHTVVKALVEIIPRLTSYLGTAAAGFAAYNAVLIASRVATLGLAAATAALRAALIRLGIGAIIVAAGELVYQFQRLVIATGSFSAATEQLGVLFREVFEGMKTGARAFVSLARAQFSELQATFLRAVAEMRLSWANFLQSVAEGARSIPFMGDAIGDSISRAADKAGEGFLRLSEASDSARRDAARFRNEAAADYQKGAERIGNAIANIQEIMRGGDVAPDSGIGGDIGDIAAAGGGGSDSSAAKREKETTDRIKEELERRFQALQDSLMSQEERLDAWYSQSRQLLNDALDAEVIDREDHAEQMLRLASEYQDRLAALEDDGFQKRLERMENEFKTEEERLFEWYQERSDLLLEARERDLLTEQDYLDRKERLDEEYAERSKRRMSEEEQFRRMTLQSMATALGAFGAQSKGFAKTAIALNAAQRISEISANTAAASVRALAELGPIAGPPAAAKIAAFGKVQMGIAAASAALQMGGGGRRGGGGAAAINTGGAGAGSAMAEPEQRNTNFRFTIQNDPMGFGENFARQIVDQINEASRNGGRVQASFG